jgi:hypothetical protein
MDIINEGPEIYSFGGDDEMRLDVTRMTPHDAALVILEHVEECCKRSGAKLYGIETPC